MASESSKGFLEARFEVLGNPVGNTPSGYSLGLAQQSALITNGKYRLLENIKGIFVFTDRRLFHR
jgi:hypothetical protein